MKKILLFNVAWLAVAIAAFTVGRSGNASAGADSDDEMRNGKRSSAGRSGSRAMSGGGSGPERSGAPGAGASRSGSKGSGVTVSQYLRETDSLVANKMFADLLLELSADNARELFDALRENDAEGQQVGLFLEAWGKIDGAAAIAAVAEMGGDGRRRSFASMSAITGWASVDPEGAKAHLAKIENGWEKGMMLQGLVSGLAKNDPAAATAYVLKVDAEQRAAAAARPEGERGRGDDRFRGFSVDRQMDAIASVQMRRGVAEATAWAEGLPAGSIKASAFDRVAEDYAQNDPVAAAEWVRAHAGNEYAERAVREVAEELARKDPAAAVNWVEQLPENSQSGAMRETMERWTRADPVAAGEYLTAMPQSEVRDSAVSSFARELDRNEPQVAADWAGSIQNEELRVQTLESVARSWMRSNAEEARGWLPASGISAESQQNILREAERGNNFGDRGGRGGRR